MVHQHFRFASALVVAATLAGGCTSRDDKAANAAANAASALQQGNIQAARRQIGQAVALRDDVSDYWQLYAQIAIAGRDMDGAFNGYENVITLDRSNVEALNRLCQIALYNNSAPRAERYAAQLALLTPGDSLPKMITAAIALGQGDKDTTRKLLNEVLAANPNDDRALIVQSRLLMADSDYAGAAQSLDKSIRSTSESGARLLLLKDLYRRSGNIADYNRTLARIARAYPDDPSAQLEYAAALYDTDDARGALAVTQSMLKRWPEDVAVGGKILNLWLVQGNAAMPPTTIAAASGDPPGVKAVLAQYANEIGRPDLALALLGGEARAAPPAAAAAGVRSAYAYALGLRGDVAAARVLLDAVLAGDPDEPRALLARARFRGTAGEVDGAVQDARRVVSEDAGNTSARLTLTDLLLRQNQPVLAEQVLRDGLRDEGADPRILKRLATLLRSQGRNASVADAMADYARKNPFSRRAARLSGPRTPTH